MLFAHTRARSLSRSRHTPSQNQTPTQIQKTPTLDRSIDPLDPSLLTLSCLNPASPSHYQTYSHTHNLAHPLALQVSELATSNLARPFTSATISLNSPPPSANDSQPTSPRKRLSFKRTSINFANLILGHSTHSSHSQHSLLSPATSRRSFQPPISPSPKSPFLLDLHQPSNNLPSCPVCNLPIPIHPLPLPNHAPCPTCGTLVDFAPPVSVSAPAPSPDSPAAPSPDSPAAPFTINEEDVARLASLAFSPADLARFDSSPSTFLQSASPVQRDQISAFHTLSASLVSGLFGSLAALSTAFLDPGGPPHPGPRSLRLALVKPFFAALVAGPGGLTLLEANLSRILARPGPELATTKRALEKSTPGQVEIKMWAWAAVLFECPLFLPTSPIPYQTRLVITARLLGLISSLPNQLHHQLVMLYSHRVYPIGFFEEKVEMVNVFIGDRIRYFLSLTDPGGGESQRGRGQMGEKGHGYMKDWAVVAGSRVMSLLFSANTISSKLTISSFYNITTDQMSCNQLVTDFTIWESRRKGYYTLTGYPFLLSIQSKIELLRYEGRRQMGFEARQAVADQLFLSGGHHHLGLGLGLGGTGSHHEPVLQISVRRNKIVEDSVKAVSLAEKDGSVRKLLKIRFVGEEGVDGGGLKKEWFLMLIRNLVSPEYGMFTIDSTSQQIWFNPASRSSFDQSSRTTKDKIISTKNGDEKKNVEGDSQDEEFRFVGTVLGLAIYHRVSLDVNLPLVCFKKLLSSPPTTTNTSSTGSSSNKNERRFILKTSNLSTSKLLEELKTFKPELAKGLEWMLGFEGSEEEFQEVFCRRRWAAEVEGWGGELVEVPLSGYVVGDSGGGAGQGGQVDEGVGGERVQGEENEEEQIVTLKNRHEFVRKYIEFIINDSIEGQFKAFAEGFLSVASGNALSLLTASELSLILRGSPDPLDITLLRTTSRYSGGFTESSRVVEMFWKVLSERMIGTEDQKKFLRFVTGSDRVPVGGSGLIRMKICKIGSRSGESINDQDENQNKNKKNNNSSSGGSNCLNGNKRLRRLPESHTCFNKINLPDDIDDADEMERRLRWAIEESEGFGLS